MHEYSRMIAIRVSHAASRIDLEPATKFSVVSAFENPAVGHRTTKIFRVLTRDDESTRDRARTCAMESRTSRLILERLARRDTLVEFFAHSKESLLILRLLAAGSNPLGYKAMAGEFHVHGKGRGDVHKLPDHAIRSVLRIMRAAGVVRLTRHGFSITDTGREVYQRMEPWMYRHTPKFRALRRLPGIGRGATAQLPRPARSDVWELRDGARTNVTELTKPYHE